MRVIPASQATQSGTAAPDDRFKNEFTSGSRVEAFLDFRLQPVELLAATLLMRDCGDDRSFATAIRAFADLRGDKPLEGSRQFYGSG